jgi:hypothetical protein
MKPLSSSLISLAALMVCSVQAGNPPLAQLGKQIETADYSQDVAALSALRQTLSDAVKQAGAPDKYLYYYIGYADYCLADAYAATDASKATDSLHDADTALKQALAVDPDFADADALLGSSYGFEIGLHPFKGIWLGSKADASLAHAMKLAPQDPMVLLLQGLSDFSTPASYGGDKQRALQEYNSSLALYATYKAADERAPLWGEAEAHVLRGELEASLGEVQAAQTDYRAALALAADYKVATEQLTKLATTPPSGATATGMASGKSGG